MRHCLTLPQTAMVRAPASLLVWKEAMLSRKAMAPLPISAIMTDRVSSPDCTCTVKRLSSPVM